MALRQPLEPSQLDISRHSLAHLMAAAVQKLWPTSRFGVGPLIDNGFYYDLQIPDYSLKNEDLDKIEKNMAQLISAKHQFIRSELPIDAAIKKFKKLDQPFKVELLEDLKTKGTTRLDASEAEVLPAGSLTGGLHSPTNFTPTPEALATQGLA